MNGKRKYYPYIINGTLKTSSLPKEVWLSAELESFLSRILIQCLQQKTVIPCAMPATLVLIYSTSWKFSKSRKKNQSIALSLSLWHQTAELWFCIGIHHWSSLGTSVFCFLYQMIITQYRGNIYWMNNNDH